MKQWEDITRVSLPLPFPLKVIHSYLIRGSNGYTIIDTGLNYPESRSVWEKTKEEMGWKWSQVERIVLTHYHPDHYGMAGFLQQRTGAPVYVSRTDYEQAQLFWGEGSEQPEVLARFFAWHGLTGDILSEIPAHLRSFNKWVEPHPTPTFIAGGEKILLGDREYQIFHTPGHADGHLSFYDPEREWLIGGDFLLPRITPNISLWPGCDPDPLATYLKTLDKMASLPVKKVFPSHGPVFEHYKERINELRKHHQQRLEEMKNKVGNGSHAMKICNEHFGHNLSIHNLRFALSETLAHLEYLVNQGELKREERDGVWYYFNT